MLKIIGLDHIVLRTDRVDEMLGFYCDVLGCVIERTLPEKIGLIQLRAGSSLIDIVPLDSELGRLGGKAPSQDGRNMEHFCLIIEDPGEQRLRDYLDQQGVASEPMVERYGAAGFSKSLYIQDPQGNVVELKMAAEAAG